MKPRLHCSFCGKSDRDVRRLIAGPGVYICNECVDLCCDITEAEPVFPVCAMLGADIGISVQWRTALPTLESTTSSPTKSGI